jgi:hypothetical protein
MVIQVTCKHCFPHILNSVLRAHLVTCAGSATKQIENTERQGKGTVKSGYGNIKEMFITNTCSHMTIRDHVQKLHPYAYRLSYSNSWQSLLLPYKPLGNIYPSSRPWMKTQKVPLMLVLNNISTHCGIRKCCNECGPPWKLHVLLCWVSAALSKIRTAYLLNK